MKRLTASYPEWPAEAMRARGEGLYVAGVLVIGWRASELWSVRRTR
jgi:hypothetical protein